MSLGTTLRAPSHVTISWTRIIAVLVFAVVSLAFAVLSRAEPAMAKDAPAVYFSVSR